MIAEHGNIVEVRLQGDFVDGSVWKERSAEISEVLSAREAPFIAVNMCRVRSITSVALGSLVFLSKRIVEIGGAVALVAVPPKIMRVIRAAHLHQVFQTWDSIDDLMRDLGERPPTPSGPD